MSSLAVFLLATIAVSAVDTLLVSHNKNPETWQHTAEYVFDDGSSIVAVGIGDNLATNGGNQSGTWYGGKIEPSPPLDKAAKRAARNGSTNRREIDVLLTTHNHKPETWQLVTERVFDDGSSIVAWALAATWPVMEVVRMVLAGIWEKRTRRKARAEGIEEGEQRANTFG